jgi:hypothetical protein
MSFAYLHGRQRQFLIRTVEMLVIGLAITVFAASVLHSLTGVAIAEVATVGTWWFLNEWDMRDLTGQSFRDWMRFLGIAALASTGYAIAVLLGHHVIFPGLFYTVWAAFAALLFCRSELRFAASTASQVLTSRGVSLH